MYELTNKNYQRLPEVKSKKNVVDKKEDHRQRMEAVKKLEKKRKSYLAKKKNSTA